MKKAIIGKKLGMTQIFDAKGNVIPVTLIEAGPCVVSQKKTIENDGYEAWRRKRKNKAFVRGRRRARALCCQKRQLYGKLDQEIQEEKASRTALYHLHHAAGGGKKARLPVAEDHEDCAGALRRN